MESRPVVAAFDLDGTLTEGGSVGPWLRALGGTVQLSKGMARHLAQLTAGALLSGPAADNGKEELFREILAGQPLDHVRDVSRTFALSHLASQQRAPVVERLRWHQDQGHDVVIVSASPELYVSVVAEFFGADGAIGTRLAIDEAGCLTGGYLGRNCRGAEKIRRFDEWVTERRYEQTPVRYGYGNSRGDRRLLAAVDHPYDVGKLGAFGALRQFPRLSSV
jgi:phosphatidylglycerophosphatase C